MTENVAADDPTADLANLAPEIKALALVGRFLQKWSHMELMMRKAMEKAFGLDSIQSAIIASNTQLRDKIHILKTAVNLALPSKDTRTHLFIKTLTAISESSYKRNMLAHDGFYASDDGDGVKFYVTQAKGKFAVPDIIWSRKQFADEYDRIDGDAHALAMLRDVLTHARLAAALSKAPPRPTPGHFGLASLFLLGHPIQASRPLDTILSNPEKYSETP